MTKPYVPRPQKEIDHIEWKQSQVNNLVADFTKTIETLTAECKRLKEERDEFIRRLKDHVCYNNRADEIDRIAKEVFK